MTRHQLIRPRFGCEASQTGCGNADNWNADLRMFPRILRLHYWRLQVSNQQASLIVPRMIPSQSL